MNTLILGLVELYVTFATTACALKPLRHQYQYSVRENITYKEINGEKLVGDIYLPDKEGAKPAILVVHGGGWNSRSGDMSGLSRYLTQQGLVVFNITYRLAPAVHYPAPVEDVTDALNWLRNNANKYGVDPERIAGWGYSAGAHLILLVGLNPKNKMKAIVGGGSPTDFSIFDPVGKLVTGFIGGNFYEKKDAWLEASPVRHVDKKSPPVFLYHGQSDSLVPIEQMRRMEMALKEKGIPVETYEAPFWGHVGVYIFSRESIQRGTDYLFNKFGI